MNKRWTVTSRPKNQILPEHFTLEQDPVPEPSDGQILIETLLLTTSPPARMWLTSGGLSGKPIPIGDVMRGTGIGRVKASRHPEFSEGEIVSGGLGWQTHCLSDGTRMNPVSKVLPPQDLPLSTRLHVLGASGASAWFGLLEVGRLQEGDTVVVSGAAGSVGSIVCQLATQRGCRVIGIAGGEAKCRWLVDTLGCTAAIDYKHDDVAARLKSLCAGAIDVFFDNVGGDTLDAALAELAIGARVVLCGGTSQYERDGAWQGPRNYFHLVYRQASMAGFYVYNFADRFDEALLPLEEGVRSGSIQYAEERYEGIEQAPLALQRLLAGQNFGSTVISVAAD
ncbi:MAG: NADP-dependent oxidoreductase [Pseudomonadales bacterium]